ncbi:MAG: PAS domain S-box protein, partial [Proteobacteria bacterium]
MNAKAPSQEQVASHNLRATHEMLDTFAKSKRALESILENQTDIFAIFTETGKLISGNAALATYLKTESDVLFRSSIKTLFSNESWQLFSNKMEILKKHRERNNINFELVLDGERASSGQTYDFQWTISRFDNVSARRGNVYTVIGRDMTATKKNQERLNMVFNSVPLAIFHINREKKLTAPYSSYTEILFGLENLDQMPASDVFAKALLSSSSTQRFGLDQLLE